MLASWVIESDSMEEKAKAEKGTSQLESALNEFNESKVSAAKEKAAKALRPPGKKKAVKKKKPVIVTRGKRKKAIARASISPGSGRILINGLSAELIKPKEIKDLVLEPIIISKKVSEMMNGYDVKLNVYGGGVMGQAQAARTALARAIVETSKDEGLRKAYTMYDRSMLVEDHRRVEPKKFGGPKARARNQTSYR